MRHSHYERFMKYFPGNNTFQIFGDKKNLPPMVLENHDPVELMKLNNKGYGIFVAVNKTNGKGRTAKNIIGVRAVFADLDGSPLNPAMEDAPALVVESSLDKYHCYWFTASNFPLAGFKGVQEAIAVKYNSDPSVKDLPRVLRVPGFFHQKGDKFGVRIVYENPDYKELTYAECVKLFPPKKVKQWIPKKSTKSDRNKSDSFDVGYSIEELLHRFGWKKSHANNFTRPGKEHGVSGTLLDSDYFYVHTSSTCLKPQSGVDSFEILAQYEFGGDKKRCASTVLQKRKDSGNI